MEFISPKIIDVLGYEPGEMDAMFLWTASTQTTKDISLVFKNRAIEFFKQLPLQKRRSYKYQHDYRIKTKNGSYIRLLQQIIPKDYDETNYYRSFVLHTDISHIKPDGTPCFSIIGLDDEPSYYNLQDTEILTKSYDLFTKRKREILKSIVEGKSSKQIAAELHLSLHTVNTHRKNILIKADCKSPVDLVIESIHEGWV